MLAVDAGVVLAGLSAASDKTGGGYLFAQLDFST
jgi:hypothetical protein